MGMVQEILTHVEEIQTNADANKVIERIIQYLQIRIEQDGDSFGQWEKYYCCQAISALDWNSGSHGLPEAWLRYSLACIKQAEVPENERNRDFVQIDAVFDKIQSQDLLSRLRTLSPN